MKSRSLFLVACAAAITCVAAGCQTCSGRRTCCRYWAPQNCTPCALCAPGVPCCAIYITCKGVPQDPATTMTGDSSPFEDEPVPPHPIEGTPVEPDEIPPRLSVGDWTYIRAEHTDFLTMTLFVGDVATPHRRYHDHVYFQIPEGLSPGVHKVRVVSGSDMLAEGRIEVRRSN